MRGNIDFRLLKCAQVYALHGEHSFLLCKSFPEECCLEPLLEKSEIVRTSDFQWQFVS